MAILGQQVAKILSYGSDNRLPTDILNALMDSGTASDCWDKIDSFLQADGFSNLEASNFLVNPLQNADELLDRITSDYSYLDGFALRVKYNLGLQAAEVYHVPFHTIRKRDDGNYIINPTYGLKQVDKQKDEIIEPFNPNAEVVGNMLTKELKKAKGKLEDMNQGGQLLVVFRQTAKNQHYPVPKFWTLAGSKDIKSDAEIAVTDLDNLENNFTPPVIVFVPGQYDNQKVNPETGLTQHEALKEQISSLTDKENRSQAVLLTGATQDHAPKLIAWDNSKPVLALDAKRETIANAVCRHFGVPPILVGLYKAGALSQSKEILNAISLFMLAINRKQRVIQRVFSALFPNEDDNFWAISTLSVLNEIPDGVMDVLTPEEKRALGGYAPLENKVNNENDEVIKALATLPALVANKVLEQMTAEEIRGLVGLGPKAANEETITPETDANIES